MYNHIKCSVIFELPVFKLLNKQSMQTAPILQLQISCYYVIYNICAFAFVPVGVSAGLYGYLYVAAYANIFKYDICVN